MERKIYVAWLDAEREAERGNGAQHSYYLGKCVALTEMFAALKDIPFHHASAQLVAMKNRGE